MIEHQQANLSIEQAIGVIRRRAPLILLCFVLAGGAAFALSRHQVKKYTATAALVFNNNQLSQQVAGLQPVSSGSNQLAQADTNVKLVQLGDMAEKTATRLNHGLTKETVKEDVSVSAQGESNIVDVAATATSPTLAAEMANTYASQFVKEQQNTNHAYYASALALVEKQLKALSTKERAGTAGLALQDRAQSLGVLAELRNGNVQVAQVASVPTGPSSPKVSRNTILGAILGLLFGIALAFLLERFDRRIREPEDLEKLYGLPLLGVIPESKALSRLSRVSDKRSALSSGESESFHLIRAHLRYFNVDRDLRTLMVVSAAPGDGKTTIARHLAAAAARMGSRVLLMEVDLRRPTIAKQLDIASGPGLSDVLIGAVSLNEAIQSIALDLSTDDATGERTFDALVAGSVLPPNPGELVESRAMETVLERARSVYDLVMIDTPPLTAVSDAFALLRKVDGIVIVGRVGRNRRDIAERLHETLQSVGAPVLGVIANGVKTSGMGSYAYAYDYAPSSPGKQPPSAPASPNGASSTGEPHGQPSPRVEA